MKKNFNYNWFEKQTLFFWDDFLNVNNKYDEIMIMFNPIKAVILFIGSCFLIKKIKNKKI